MNKITLLLLIFSVTFANAQSSWKKINSNNSKAKSELMLRKTILTKFNLYDLNATSFKNELINNKNIIIPVNDKLSNFEIKEVVNFTNPIANKYGFIKSFSLKGIDDKTATGKITFGTDGVHIIIFSGKHSTVYIDPYTKDKTTYITYNKSNIENQSNDSTCLLDDHETALKNTLSKSAKTNVNDGNLRSYRLALASTIEYSNFHIQNQGLSNSATDSQKKAAVLSAMNTTMARVNGLFEKDLGVTFNIVLNSGGENELIFIDSDNFSNNDARSLLSESQVECDRVIGSNNYDIGHTFSTGAGGLAFLGVLCRNGSKAGGVTGTTSPIGDSFDIDLVAHEIGHQFGANHSYNSSCDFNRNDDTAAEPGSGSTIMGYAGICAPTNVQNRSDDYFHAISIAQMWDVIDRTSCATEISNNNSIPVANAGNDVFVPKSTPLILRGTASDDDINTLTYCWEQSDLEIATMPPLATNTGGPLFRSFSPTASPDRYLPLLATVIGGSTATEWEVLPSVARELNFSLTVRDNDLIAGATGRDDLKITVIDTDPFIVTSQNTAVTWNIGTVETITWDKSTTDQAPINCENVRIKLSTDGGLTFPTILTESTPNNGSFDLDVPNVITSTARIMIEGIDNAFYNVNASNFSIIASGPTFIISNITPTDDDLSITKNVCNDTSSSIIYNLDVNFINDFSETVTLSVNNLPEGVSAVFSQTTISNSTEVTLTINNFETAAVGEYLLTINGISLSINSNTELPTLNVFSNNFDEVTLVAPINNAINIPSQSNTFTWLNTGFNTTSYDLDIALDTNFDNIIVSRQNITNNSYTFSGFLEFSTSYYWRVKPKNNCGEGTYSTTYSFTTQNTGYCVSNFLETDNSEYISNVTLATINNNSGDDSLNTIADGYEDFTNISTSLTQGVTYPLSVTLDPVGFSDHCYVFIDWNGDFNFNTTTERYDLGEHFDTFSTATQDIIVPEDATLGETRMRVVIEYFNNNGQTFGEGPCNNDHNSEFGETEDYTINIINDSLTYSDNVFENFILNLIVNQGTIQVAFDIPNTENDVTLDIFDIRGRKIQSNTFKSNTEENIFNESLDLSSFQSAIYILHIQNGNKRTAKKIYIK